MEEDKKQITDLPPVSQSIGGKIPPPLAILPKREEKEVSKEVIEKTLEKKSEITKTSVSVESKEEKKKTGLFGFFKKAKTPVTKKTILASSKPKKTGNAFAQVFEHDTAEDDADLIDTIVSAAKKEKEEKTKVLGDQFTKIAERQKKKAELKRNTSSAQNGKKKSGALGAARFSLFCAVLIPLFSWLFFETTLNAESVYADMIGVENFAATLQETKNKETQKKGRLNTIQKERKEIKQERSDISNDEIMEEIRQKRVDFLAIMQDIERISLDSMGLNTRKEDGFSPNDVLRYLVFHRYSARIEKKGIQVSVAGVIRDPNGKSFTQLTKLIDDINSEPQFSRAELRNFSKKKDNDGGDQTSFNLEFSYLHIPENSL